MKSIDEVRQIKILFSNEYRDAFLAVDNNLAVGLGKDSKTGELTIEARLTSDKLKTILPTTYHDVKVNIEVIGVLKAL